MLKRDHFVFGIFIGLIIPVMLYALILLINYLLVNAAVTHIYLERKSHILIGIAGNLLPIRYYFVSLKFDKTGRGILLITFILLILFFAFKDRLP